MHHNHGMSSSNALFMFLFVHVYVQIYTLCMFGVELFKLRSNKVLPKTKVVGFQK